jgi:RHS repeat-associated core domain
VGRPEAVTDASQTVVWRAQNFAFTQNVIVANIAFNLGFPGQYYDAETAAWNNGFRDYKSGVGRYLESDPIGLGGGINTYAYAGNNSLSYVDPRGLAVGDQYRTIDAAGIAAVSDVLPASITQNIEYAGVIYQNWNGSYSYTAANPGTDHTSDAGDTPWFHTEVADYHTHGADDEDGLSEIFSPADIQGNDEQHILGYLGTPHLAIKKYDPCKSKVTILQIGVTP